MIIKRRSLEHNIQLFILVIQSFLAHLQTLVAGCVLTSQPLKFILLNLQEFIASLNAEHEVSLQLRFRFGQVQDVLGHLIVVYLKPVPLVLLHPASEHHNHLVVLLHDLHKVADLHVLDLLVRVLIEERRLLFSHFGHSLMDM